MDQTNYTQQLFNFLKNSPTAFHTVQNISNLLVENDFKELFEHEPWDAITPGFYFIRRNGSSLIIVSLADDNCTQSGFRMAGAHTDSPALKIKPNADIVNSGLLQLGVEVYGGALLDPWFDRDLSIAGNVTVHEKKSDIKNLLIDFKRPIAIIPSLAIHLNKEANEEKKINKQTDLVPIIMQHQDSKTTGNFKTILLEHLKKEHGIMQGEILGYELFLYDTQPSALVGIDQEFITGMRLDNLVSCFCLTTGLLEAESNHNSIIVLNDHEEVGSLSYPGAQGPFLKSVLERLIPDTETRQRCLNRSLFISTDNAHAVHPNFVEKYDKNHLPQLNMGPVIKYNANQRYATTSRTSSFYRLLAGKSEVPVQEFVMRNDLACGSTIGPITSGTIGIQTLDIGVPSLAMHSIREMVGVKDFWQLYKVLQTYFGSPQEDEMWQCLAD